MTDPGGPAAPSLPDASAAAPVLETTLAPPPPGPTAAAERDPVVDALRGAALLGVLAINLFVMGYPDALVFSVDATAVPGGWALQVATVLFMGKAYALLALLFGHGVGLQSARLAAAGRNPARLLRRRLLALGATGVVHGLLGWYGDVLLSYAAFGLLLLLFLRTRPRLLLAWAGGLLAVGAAFFLVTGGLLHALMTHPALAERGARVGQVLQALGDEDLAAAMAAYAQGPYGALFLRRLGDAAANWGGSLVVLPEILALFLAGLWAARTGALHDPAWRPRLARVAAALVLVGLPLNLLHARLAAPGLSAGAGLPVLALAAYTLAGPALGAGVAIAAGLLRETAPVRALTRLLSPLGRLSLSAYLLQTLVFTNVFYFHGLGLYAEVPFPVLLALAPAFWLIEVALAHAWLARFRLGPAEWLLRRLEYGRLGSG